jgi:hypothetical protein
MCHDLPPHQTSTPSSKTGYKQAPIPDHTTESTPLPFAEQFLRILLPHFSKPHGPTKRSGQPPRPLGEGWGEGKQRLRSLDITPCPRSTGNKKGAT